MLSTARDSGAPPVTRAGPLRSGPVLIEPGTTAKVAKVCMRMQEVPIYYRGGKEAHLAGRTEGHRGHPPRRPPFGFLMLTVGEKLAD